MDLQRLVAREAIDDASRIPFPFQVLSTTMTQRRPPFCPRASKPLFRAVFALVLVGSLSACNVEPPSVESTSVESPFVEALRSGMQDDFSDGCYSNQQCLADLDAYAEGCFDRKLADEAITHGTSPRARALHTEHINKYQACIADESGVDHWADLDMVDYMLGEDWG
ncbi:hypothetical protein [Lysobacter sp. F60174L2]|uniref:hypothetical protein n=1 Tax=Lysobacter sp. F60174L2 TaxID=3459295 RepID=UPI00403DC4C9